MRATIILFLAFAFLALSQSPAAYAASANGDIPSSLYIPKIEKMIPIIPVGVTRTDNMDVPHNFVQAGWYEYGTLPGHIGSAVLDGHVDNGRAIPGVFKHLHELAVGDDIYVTDKSGETLHFKVTVASIYNQTSSSDPIFANSGLPLLKIITCYGTFIPKEDTYDRRLVITASLVG